LTLWHALKAWLSQRTDGQRKSVAAMMAFGVSRVVTDGGVRAGGEAELE
jgi:hypothetical protein